MLSEDIPASFPKKILKIIIVKNGWIIAQAAPKIVCLYRTLISRHVRKYNNSRYSQISFKFIEIHPLDGDMSITGNSECLASNSMWFTLNISHYERLKTMDLSPCFLIIIERGWTCKLSKKSCCLCGIVIS